MYNSPYFIPGYNPSMMNPNLIRGVGAASSGLMNGARGISAANTLASGAKGAGLFSRLGTGLSGIKSINWGGLINNTSKTLGIINQTIPLVRQVGPMVNNMKSMLKIASIFKDETDTPKKNNYQPKTSTKNISTNKNSNTTNQKTEYTSYNYEDYNESPTFFINT